MQVSSRYGVSYPDPIRDDRPDIPLHLKNIVDGLEKSAMYGQGTTAAKPPSSVGSPGIQGRFYMATDVTPHVLYYDYGTGWDTVGSIGAGSIGTAQLADGSVTTPKLADDAVTSAKIAAGAVGASEIADGSIAATEIANALKPSAGASAATEALRALGTAAGQAAAGIHHTQHGAAGADPLDLSGYIGAAAGKVAAGLHSAQHNSGAADALDLSGYIGTAAGKIAAGSHHAQHAAGGADPIDLSGYNLASLASPTFTGTVTTAALTVNGQATLNSLVEIINATPDFRLFENDQALDEGMWQIRAVGGFFQFVTRHDDGTVGTIFMQVNGRVGAGINPTNVDFINLRLRNKGMNVQRHPFGTADRHIESGDAGSFSSSPPSVVFTDAYASTPVVLTGTSSTGGSNGVATVQSASTTGFTFGYTNDGGSGSASGRWMSEGTD